jgi:ACS family sodium-dependent inorganic phosphate cotransporter
VQVSLAPPIAALAASAVAGSAADGLVAAGWPVARVRKAAQCTAFLGPALCLAGAAFVDDAWGAVGAAPSPRATIALQEINYLVLSSAAMMG